MGGLVDFSARELQVQVIFFCSKLQFPGLSETLHHFMSIYFMVGL